MACGLLEKETPTGTCAPISRCTRSAPNRQDTSPPPHSAWHVCFNVSFRALIKVMLRSMFVRLGFRVRGRRGSGSDGKAVEICAKPISTPAPNPLFKRYGSVCKLLGRRDIEFWGPGYCLVCGISPSRRRDQTSGSPGNLNPSNMPYSIAPGQDGALETSCRQAQSSNQPRPAVSFPSCHVDAVGLQNALIHKRGGGGDPPSRLTAGRATPCLGDSIPSSMRTPRDARQANGV